MTYIPAGKHICRPGECRSQPRAHICRPGHRYAGRDINMPARGSRVPARGRICQPGNVDVSPGRWRKPAVLGGYADVEPPSRWRRSRPDVLLPAPWSAPRWAPNVVVVKQHMPWDGLSWGRTYTGGSGGGKARWRPCTEHTANTSSYPGSGPSWGGNTDGVVMMLWKLLL
jgi:hypothetical protein